MQGPSYNTWIGATDEVQEMTFLWYGIDEPLSHGYTNWAHHQPDGPDHDSEQDCVYIYSHDWQWHDQECDDDMYYICEKP